MFPSSMCKTNLKHLPNPFTFIYTQITAPKMRCVYISFHVSTNKDMLETCSSYLKLTPSVIVYPETLPLSAQTIRTFPQNSQKIHNAKMIPKPQHGGARQKGETQRPVEKCNCRESNTNLHLAELLVERRHGRVES
jgi:hypothetical protein